jgi:C4-dicarboxylate-specific signal transduction histidine kinase
VSRPAAGRAAETHRLLARFDALTGAAAAAAASGDAAGLAAALDGREALLGELAPLHAAARPLDAALEARVATLVERNALLTAEVARRRDAIGRSLRELDDEAQAAAAYLQAPDDSPRVDFLG